MQKQRASRNALAEPATQRKVYVACGKRSKSQDHTGRCTLHGNMHAASANWTKLPTLYMCLALPIEAERPLVGNALITWDVVEPVMHNAKAIGQGSSIVANPDHHQQDPAFKCSKVQRDVTCWALAMLSPAKAPGMRPATERGPSLVSVCCTALSASL